jgi:putative membrane protein insertion efficiency factor
MRLLIRLLQAPIALYRLTLSPFLVPSCRFSPSCSAYALEALERHGPVRGLFLALRRLLRCHPVRWLGGREGYDPVPPRLDPSPCCGARERP